MLTVTNEKFFGFDKLVRMLKGSSEMATMMKNSIVVGMNLEGSDAKIERLAGYKQPDEKAFDKIVDGFEANGVWTYDVNWQRGNSDRISSIRLRFYFLDAKDLKSFKSHLTKMKLAA